jgi:CHASE2 domain-containing sensor protein/predicted Ser/Thr protein kinase
MEEQRPPPQDDRADALAAQSDSSGGTTQPSPETPKHDSHLGAAPAGLADSLPGYTLLREIHRGGQGVVFEAIQHSTRRKVAIKVLHEGPLAGRHDRARFTREIEILAQLKHANIVTIHDSGSASGHVYFVMDYIAGQSLDQWSNAAPRSVEDVLRLFHRICVAVNAAHQRGIVHRDLKPGNIRVDTDDQPHILDFGLAKVPAAPLMADEPAAMTLTGQFMGSLPWASPEQAEAIPGRIDPRTDVYALGVILYQMLTGRFPYPVVGNLRDVLSNILQAEPTRPNTLGWQGRPGRGIDNEVETIVLKCLQKDRDRRYQNAGELARDIERYLAGEPIAARRDSVIYLLRNRTRATLRRHTTLAGLAIAALAALLACYWPGAPLIYDWTPANRVFEEQALAHRPSGPPLANVRVITLTDKTDLQQVAAVAGIDVGCLTQDLKCLRRVHGRLMEKLAAAGAAAVAWDIAFMSESPYDQDFLRGVRALEKAHCEVIVAADTWTITAEQARSLSQWIASATHWGCSPAGLQTDQPWRVYLAVQRPDGDPLPSLALRTFAAARRPGREFDVHLDAGRNELTLAYWKSPESIPGSEGTSGESDAIRVNAILPAQRDQPQFGLKRNDMLAYYLLDLPGDDVLAGATLDYGQALAADTATLKSFIGGRVVIIGDQRGGRRIFPTPDQRRLAGTYAHAAAIDTLLQLPLRMRPAFPGTALAALLGLLAGRFLFRRPWARSAALLLGCTAVIILAFGEALYGRLMYNPLIAVLALVITSELSARVYAAIGLGGGRDAHPTP